MPYKTRLRNLHVHLTLNLHNKLSTDSGFFFTIILCNTSSRRYMFDSLMPAKCWIISVHIFKLQFQFNLLFHDCARWQECFCMVMCSFFFCVSLMGFAVRFPWCRDSRKHIRLREHSAYSKLMNILILWSDIAKHQTGVSTFQSTVANMSVDN